MNARLTLPVAKGEPRHRREADRPKVGSLEEQMIYKLYGLTEKEIKIVEGEK